MKNLAILLFVSFFMHFSFADSRDQNNFEFLSEYSYLYCDENQVANFDKCLSELNSVYVGEAVKLFLSRKKPTVSQFVEHYNKLFDLNY